MPIVVSCVTRGLSRATGVVEPMLDLRSRLGRMKFMSDPDLEAMAKDELSRAMTLTWRDLSR
jgi:hypothetical protein